MADQPMDRSVVAAARVLWDEVLAPLEFSTYPPGRVTWENGAEQDRALALELAQGVLDASAS